MLQLPRLLILTVLTLIAAPLAAQTRPVVVELFTSQGCSSCPPADAFLGELAQRPEVIALSLHVDYWDYLGWRDPFASPAMTRRQRAYAAAHGERSIYTPQMVIHGQVSAIGHQKELVNAAIARLAGEPARARVVIRPSNGSMLVEIAPLGPVEPSIVHLVSYAEPQRQQIARGENRGRNLAYHNVVTNWMRLADWSGEEVELTAPVPTMARGVAVIVQEGVAGTVIGAAKYEF